MAGLKRKHLETFSIDSEVGENDILHCIEQVKSQKRKRTAKLAVTEKLPRCKWDLKKAWLLLDVLKAFKHEHNIKKVKFNKAHWPLIHAKFSTLCEVEYTLTQLSGKFDRWYKDWKIWTQLREKTGVGWDPIEKKFTCDDWEGMNQLVKGSKSFENQSFPLYDEVNELFRNQSANPNRAMDSSHHPSKPSCSYRPMPPSQQDLYSNTTPNSISSEECESPQPAEKGKGKRSGGGRSSNGHKRTETGEMLQACLSRIDEVSIARLNIAKKEFTVELLGTRVSKSLLYLGLEGEAFLKVFMTLTTNIVLAEGFISFPEDVKRLYVKGVLEGK